MILSEVAPGSASVGSRGYFYDLQVSLVYTIVVKNRHEMVPGRQPSAVCVVVTWS